MSALLRVVLSRFNEGLHTKRYRLGGFHRLDFCLGSAMFEAT